MWPSEMRIRKRGRIAKTTVLGDLKELVEYLDEEFVRISGDEREMGKFVELCRGFKLIIGDSVLESQG